MSQSIRKVGWIYLFLLFLSMSACISPPPPPMMTMDVNEKLLTPPLLVAQLDQPFTLQINQAAELADTDLRITWVSVDDERCGLCAAIYYATVTLHLQVAGQSVTEQLLTTEAFSADDHDTLAFADYQIQLLDLTPTPEKPASVVPSGTYRLQLQVTRLAPK